MVNNLKISFCANYHIPEPSELAGISHGWNDSEGGGGSYHPLAGNLEAVGEGRTHPTAVDFQGHLGWGWWVVSSSCKEFRGGR